MTLPATRAAVFDALLDDAAIFPPGNASMPDAVNGYLRSRTSADARCIGAFLCSGTRLGELVDHLPGDMEPIPLSLILRSEQELQPALAEVAADGGLALRAVELPASPQDAVDALTALPAGVLGYVELPLGPRLGVAAQLVAGAGHRVKLRTGGTVATAFPSETALADALVRCVQAGAAFKLTAGLHDTARHRDPETGFEHHGFLNVLVAVAVALDGGDVGDVTRVLAEQEAVTLAEQVRVLTDDRVAAIRSRFVAFGTCSTAEPLAGLHALGLLA